MRKKVHLTKIILLLMFVYASYVVVSTQFSMSRINTETEAKQQEVNKLKDENVKLQGEFNDMRDNPDKYYEKLARERLGLIKEGETPVINKK